MTPRTRHLLVGLALALVAGARPALAAAPAKKIAVMAIRPVDEASKPLADLLTEVVTTDLSKVGGCEVLSGSEVAAMLGLEAQRQLVGCTETSCIAEIAGGLGAEYVVFGSLGRIGSQVRVDLKFVDSRKARVLAREGATTTGEDALVESTRAALGRLVKQVDGLVPPEPAKAVPAKAEAEKPAVAAPARPVWPWVGLAGGAALVGVGGYLAWDGYAYFKDRGSLTADEAKARDPGAALEYRAGLATGVAGLAAIVATAALWPSDEPAAHASFAPALTFRPGGVSASLSATF